MTDEHEVVVTGMGAVTSLGRDPATLWEALTAGRSGVATISAFDATGYSCGVGSEVADYTPHADVPAERAARMDRGALFAIDAALQALADAKLPLTAESAAHVGLVLGSARPGEASVAQGHRIFNETGPSAMRGGYVARTLPSAPASQTAAALGIRGPTLAVSAGGASGSLALSLAAGLVRRGEVQVAFAGGADAPLTPPALAAFCAMEVLTKRNDDPAAACRPFDVSADGFALGEGAAMLVLENETLAKDRGARIYGRLSGSASVTEPAVLMPTPPEAGRAMQGALREPALMQTEIDYYCAYAAGSLELDRMETEAITRIFGAVAASRLTISAPKSMLGHLLGASGVIDAIIALKTIETGVIPPTINLINAAEGCDLDYTANEACRLTVNHAMCYAYGFGGHHVALCFSAPQE